MLFQRCSLKHSTVESMLSLLIDLYISMHFKYVGLCNVDNSLQYQASTSTSITLSMHCTCNEDKIELNNVWMINIDLESVWIYFSLYYRTCLLSVSFQDLSLLSRPIYIAIEMLSLSLLIIEVNLIQPSVRTVSVLIVIYWICFIFCYMYRWSGPPFPLSPLYEALQ